MASPTVPGDRTSTGLNGPPPHPVGQPAPERAAAFAWRPVLVVVAVKSALNALDSDLATLWPRLTRLTT